MDSHETGKLESIWVQAGPLRMHTRISPAPLATNSPSLVLIHGLVISSRYMVPTARRLATRYRVLALDLPGFGKSDKPLHVLDVPELADAVVVWMDAINLERGVFLGNSMGCQVIADLAMRYPSRVDRLILTGPTVDPNGRTAFQQVLRWLLDVPLERPSIAIPFLTDCWAAGIGRAMMTFRYLLIDKVEEKLGRITVPVLVVRGSRDAICPQAWVEEAVRLLPRGSLAVIPGAPHCVTYSAADELVRLVLMFLGAEAET